MLVTLVDSIGLVLNASTVTIGDQAYAAQNTTAIEALISSAVSFGYGKLVLPPGTIWVSEGSLLATVCIQVGATVSNLWICGTGEGVTVLKLKDGGVSHVVNLDGCSNVKISDLTVDGNRSNNTGTSWHGIRTGSSGVNGLTIERVTAQNTRGYGFGLQGGDKKRLRMVNVTAQDTGLDGCDFKNTSDNSEDLVVIAYSARRWGLDLSQTEQAGIDCRGPCQLNGIWCSEGPADGHYIRFREGETVDASLGGHYSHLSNFICEGNSGATSIGVYIAAHEVTVSGGYVKDTLLGVNPIADRVSVYGVTCESCDDESFQVNSTADFVRLTDCHSISAAHSGFRIRAPRTTMSGCSSEGDTTSGIVTEATATGFKSTNFDCVGPGGVSMVGVDINSADAQVTGGDISACFRGLSTTAVRTKFSDVYSHDNTDDGCIISTSADDAKVSGCTLKSNGDNGLTLRAARARVYGNVITSNTDKGIEIEATGADNRIDDNQISGNATQLLDSGTGTRVGLLNDGLLTPYLLSSIRTLCGTGSPEGVHTAPVGSTFHRTDGGSGTCLYVKESGTGNTGWVAK